MTSKILYPFISVILLLIAITLSANPGNSGENWPQWRGPLATGAAEKVNPPVEFNETKNLKWKTAIPGKGHATPLVWGDKIIVQTAVPTAEKIKTEAKVESEVQNRMAGTKTDLVHEFKVMVVNRNSGKIEWQTTVAKEHPMENTHVLGSWASNSACTDGKYIYAYFGSRGVHCLDFSGKIIWQRDFGQMEKHMSFGEGSSPFLYKDKLYIQWDHEKDSYLFALDTKTGKEVWTHKREEATSWATPLVVEVNGKPQLITAATTQVRAYDANTGEIIWTCTGLTRNVIPNPKYADGILYIASGFRGNAMFAIDIAKAKGDITGTDAILWTYHQDSPYTPDMLLMDGKLYFLRVNNGFLTCLDAKTGEPFYSKEKLEGISTLYSSPSGGDGKIFIAADKICLVIKAGEKFELLSSNELTENFHASPVIVGNQLILRGFESLYCFEEK